MDRKHPEWLEDPTEDRAAAVMEQNQDLRGFRLLEDAIYRAAKRLQLMQKELNELKQKAAELSVKTPTGTIKDEIEMLRDELEMYQRAREHTLKQINTILALLQRSKEAS